MLPKLRVLQPARAVDLEAVVELISVAGLPTAGLADAFPAAYSLVRIGPDVVGVAGLETYGGVGLLRSVAIAASLRGTGLGRLLVEDRLAAAREQRLGAVYLLTTTAAGFFRGLGFEEVSRAAVPADLRASSEFSSVCPATAVCLAKRLQRLEQEA